MASSMNASNDDDDAFVYIFDRRNGASPEIKLHTGGLFTFEDFKVKVKQELKSDNDDFVIASTNRDGICDDSSWDSVEKGDTLYILNTLLQELCAPAQQRVNFLPHYDTIVKGGMYEYYASEGQNPLPYAFAELIDNALTATANNNADRNIEIRLHFDEGNPNRNCIFVLDNGKGMTPRQLNNWAIYRLSKFIRKDKRRRNSVDRDDNSAVRYEPPRSLNSDISYFGVGGKQAIFYIGNATKMITRPAGSKDIHELTISKDDFEKKEKNNESIYSGFIRNRKPSDSSHVAPEDEIFRKIITEEEYRESFTVVAITGINSGHIPYLKHNLREWCRQLAHIYHYYLHGPNGNQDPPAHDPNRVMRPASPFRHINIEIKLFKGLVLMKNLNLRDINDDLQSQFVKTGASVFDFKAKVEGAGVVEGVLRYHPFLYDHETFPTDFIDPRYSEPEDDHDYAINDRPARGRRPVFECYWNGRLIPYTLIEEFDWCSAPKKSKVVPADCYNRVSGVLWTNDKFQVSTNKLTFIDLEMKLKEKSTVFCRIINGHEKRTGIDKEFVNWLKECHEKFDKQIHFSEFKGHALRPDLPKHRQTPWSVYEQVEWDGKIFKKGNLVRISRTVPTILGTIKCFLLYGDHEGEVYATGGDIQLIQEPRCLYNEVKVQPLFKLDRLATPHQVKKAIEEEEAKLPDQLVVSWPDDNEVVEGERRPAGKTIGDIKVEIINKKGETIKQLPGTAPAHKKLLVELKIIWHSSNGDEVIVSHISQHGKNWPYWFRKMENIKNLGHHTLQLQVVLNESGATTFAGKDLPSHRIKFFVTEAEPKKFTVALLDGPFRVGVPFQIPLEFQDEFNHITAPNSDCKPTLEASGLDISYDSLQVKGNHLLIKGISAKGLVNCTTGKNFNLTVKVDELEEKQTLKIRLLPGPPYQLSVKPDQNLNLENGTAPVFNVEVLDIAGNVTTENKLVVTCKFQGISGLPVYSLDCSSSGTGILTGESLYMKKVKSNQEVVAKIELQNSKDVKTVERKLCLIPSGKTASIDLSYNLYNEDGTVEKTVRIKNSQEVVAVAGEYMQGLTFLLLDEAGREIKMDEKISSKIKVNWTPKMNKELLLQKKLPDIKIPTSISDQKYCHVSILDGSDTHFSFTIKAKAGEPSQMKCKVKGSCSLRIKEQMESEIQVSIRDKNGNEIIDFQASELQELNISGDGLITDKIQKYKGQQCAFCVKGIQLEDVHTGSKELMFQWKKLKDYIRIELVSGPPSQLIIPGWDLDEPIVVYDGGKINQHLVVSLCDDRGNQCKEKDVKILLNKDQKIKIVPSATTLKTDNEGQVDFGTFSVNGPKGVYELSVKALLGGSRTIAGPRIKISIRPDPTKPLRLEVDCKSNIAVEAGSKLPVYTVKVLAEDGNPLTLAKHSHLSMKQWPSDSSHQSIPPPKAISYAPDNVNNEKGIFTFSNKRCPELAGKFSIMFVYYDGKYNVDSEVISLTVLPSVPTKLVPLETLGTPTVSNSKNNTSRCLIESLLLELRDQFDNPVEPKFDGSVKIVVKALDEVDEIPAFVGPSKQLLVPLLKGRALLQKITLQENTPGKDGFEYVLSCTVSAQNIKEKIEPLEIPFLFYNDCKKQSRMASLSKERDTIQIAIRAYKSMFETTEQLINELKISNHEASHLEQQLRMELKKQNIPLAQLQSIEQIDILLQTRMTERDELLSRPRRLCGLAQTPSDPEILGKIGQLAELQDHDIARVLSWHMSADMDCVVTTTTKKAKEIYNQTSGKQQVLPLDSIYKKTLPEWDKPLPHEKFRPQWKPPGNPVYARKLLKFSHQEEKCKLVFGMLLGDTMFLDSLDYANSYRQEVVKFAHCPTILTRDGDRIRSNGKFGGLMNKALPLDKLRGAVFGEPLPVAYHAICTQIDTLHNYRAAVKKRQNSETDLLEQQRAMNNPEMKMKMKECSEAEERLRVIEQKLGMCLAQSQSSAMTSKGKLYEQYETPVSTKKPRLSTSSIPYSVDTGNVEMSSPALNGTGAGKSHNIMNNSGMASNSGAVGVSTPTNNNFAPTRQSKRIASMTPVTSDDGRKRLRKT
ncbi:structural maintenance of chromosomes flexible hinge domain-containing protein 1 isoform X1 [Octopus bimaculoides]|uniref:SMC hinge domain-containing protein n=1 Tax=Octopus bimaculoides TaxID=37653 RepID=A0A0L8HN42_OCTBM|nr:structural maintenance of chromosomes flexible hinge domain-containing protein 1 isoform X1 [Octopus bimaculoides]|eukprot:XP_014770922.1 PREDICTED: structural maintenance of chromosomes flexible hinge domain-containing protein 1-like isoform X1 [Octopus bimaculoides]